MKKAIIKSRLAYRETRDGRREEETTISGVE